MSATYAFVQGHDYLLRFKGPRYTQSKEVMRVLFTLAEHLILPIALC
jgi:hypothetical protein